MSFESQLKDVFDIDIWQLKSQYMPIKDDNLADNIKVNVNSDKTTQITPEILYSNDIDSHKAINIFISDSSSINFYKNIAASLFFKSKVNIYSYQPLTDLENINSINITDKELLKDGVDLFSLESKRNILEKLYQYADFSSK